MKSPKQKIQFAMIDPPWKWQARSAKGEGRSPKYIRQDLEWLKRLDLRSIMANDSCIGLWVIDPMIPHALELVSAWADTFKLDKRKLRYSSVLFYWAKTARNGGGLQPAWLDSTWFMGNGYSTRANPEQCWLLRIGNGLPRKSMSVRRLIASVIGEHSQKPDRAYKGVEQLYGDNIVRADIFAREKRDGWLVFGDEVKSDFDISLIASKPHNSTLEGIVKQLESCGYTCEAGKLENNIDFVKLKEISNQ